MSELLHTEDLVDAHDVAEILGLTHPNRVTDLKRYADMPQPRVHPGRGRPRLAFRPEIEKRHAERARRSVIAARAMGDRGDTWQPT